jgi:hypothetical protein
MEIVRREVLNLQSRDFRYFFPLALIWINQNSALIYFFLSLLAFFIWFWEQASTKSRNFPSFLIFFLVGHTSTTKKGLRIHFNSKLSKRFSLKPILWASVVHLIESFSKLSPIWGTNMWNIFLYGNLGPKVWSCLYPRFKHWFFFPESDFQ